LREAGEQRAAEAVGSKLAGVVMPLLTAEGQYRKNMKETCEAAHACGALVMGLAPGPIVFSDIFKPAELGLDLFGLCLTGEIPASCQEAEVTSALLVTGELASYIDGPVAEKQNSGIFSRRWPERNQSVNRFFETSFRDLIGTYLWIFGVERGERRQRVEAAALNANYLAKALLAAQGQAAAGLFSAYFSLPLKLSLPVDRAALASIFDRAGLTLRAISGEAGETVTVHLACDGTERIERLDETIEALAALLRPPPDEHGPVGA
jgi:hypothetical protein